jgi:hypothetical protein
MDNQKKQKKPAHPWRTFQPGQFGSEFTGRKDIPRPSNEPMPRQWGRK